MIIKDKPLRVPACQAILCWFHASPVVSGVVISSPFGCDAGYVRRWPGFPQLEAYKARLSGYLVTRRFYADFDSGFSCRLEAGRVGGRL